MRGLIVDHDISGMTGLDLTARLREAGWQVPVLLITSAPSLAIVMRAATLGIETVLEKPLVDAAIMIFADSLDD